MSGESQGGVQVPGPYRFCAGVFSSGKRERWLLQELCFCFACVLGDYVQGLAGCCGLSCMSRGCGD